MVSYRGEFFVIRFCIDGLDDRDVTCLECRFTVLEVVVPLADEGFAKSLFSDCR